MRLRQLAWRSGLKGISLLAVGCLGLGGCKSWIDQSELARESGQRLVVPILKSIDPVDEGELEFQGAQDVRADDLKVIPTDYVIGPNDLVTVSVFDLAVGGVETTRTARVSETGLLSLPMLGEPVKATGMTEQQLQKSIAEKYRQAELLQNARVSVTVIEARQRTFSIMGAVARPGRYGFVQSDYRLLNALVEAGDVTSPVDNLYVIRKLRSEQPAAQPDGGTTPAPANTQPAADPLAPRSEAPAPRPVMAAEQPAAPATAPADPDRPRPLPVIEGKTLTDEPVGPAVPATRPATPGPVGPAATQPAFEFGATLQAEEDQRVIRVPLQQLRNGDLRYNIVIRPDDVIIIPVPTPGFYYMGGHVAVPGAYNVTGQKITLKQAVAAARMLDGLAVPARTDVIRRVNDQEVYVRVDLSKIFKGTQPDLFLKPNDTVVVGTDWYPPFLQAARGAFRMTYGFGFLYDRNYAPEQSQDN